LHVAAIHDDDGRVSMLVSQIHDISHRIEAHAADRWRATHDPLGEDTVGRLGGDEFMVILNGCDDRAHALRAAQHLRKGLATVLRSNPSYVGVSASIGMAVAPPTTINELMRLADAALYQAKAAGKDSVVLA
jgi:diguanylate cyclase (GGDEF)-like protein